ncbi:Noc2-domain-containing protein [Schizopora paradoxa]|uniref:Noc2-domain-containing protein n=1 Tax=Schizopora paradoxa TaxID=27342 RepID=A0A0H2RYA7_9AGAM|nr:Noc2-domain-containing protein [Schizopora paradoxa]
MGKKASKASRKYAASGQLKKEIESRKKHQQIKRNIERKRTGKPGFDKENANGQRKGKEKAEDTEEGDDAEEEGNGLDGETGQFKGMSVDDFLKGDFMEDGSDKDEDEEDENEEDEEMDEDDGSFASLDDLEDEGVAHKLELAKLAEKDPEFFKYLQENDQELLDFDVDEEDVSMDDDEDGGDREDEEEVKAPSLTKEHLKRWQKALLEHRSLRSLKKLLIAFRAAAHMNDDNESLAWTIDSPAVYEKLVATALRYTPVVLDHHVPYKTLPDGKFKPPSQSTKLKALQKLVQSYFFNILHLIDQLTDHDTILLAVNESVKIAPYIVSSRKAMKLYIKTCLKLWSSADDDIRIASYIILRKLAISCDEGVRDMVLKNTYLTLLRNAKSTTAHTLPSINLMKNSASELFCADHASSYQHAFMYIRQLAVHLRNSMKVKSKEAYRQVYNWQYVHAVDFWSIVLAKACDAKARAEKGGAESELQALLYPLTQVSLGAVKLVPSSRSFPFHLHILRSLIHLSSHTEVYIPLPPYLLPIITASLAPTSKPKSSTLRPIDLETAIRAPGQYQRTRVFLSTVLEEAIFLLATWLAARPVQASVAFPEVVVPVLVSLRKGLKKASGGKEAAMVKGLVDRVEECARIVAEKRKGVNFGPKALHEVRAWERALDVEETPLGKYVKSQAKLREKRRQLVEKVCDLSG